MFLDQGCKIFPPFAIGQPNRAHHWLGQCCWVELVKMCIFLAFL